MRLRKIFVCTLLSLIVIIETISLGWSAANRELPSSTIYAIRTAFSLYVLGLAIHSVHQDTIGPHTKSILHLTVLSTLASALLISTAVLPSSPISVTYPALDTFPALRGPWYATLALYTIVCVTTFTSPTGPPLHYPPELIYSEKTIAASINKDPDNVCGVTG